MAIMGHNYTIIRMAIPGLYPQATLLFDWFGLASFFVPCMPLGCYITTCLKKNPAATEATYT